MFGTNAPALGAPGDTSKPSTSTTTYPRVLLAVAGFAYLAYLMSTGFTPEQALLYAACSTAVMGGVSYTPGGLAKLLRALEQL